MDNAPTIGTFIRPVPAALYCYEVVRVIQRDDEGPEQWWCKRWGYDPKTEQPVKDGHQDIHYLNGLTRIGDEAWKDPWEFDTPRWSCCPLYYRRIIPRGSQGNLF